MSSRKLTELLERAAQGQPLDNLLPEAKQLQDVIENQSWHDRQDVLDHSIKTLKALDAIPSSLPGAAGSSIEKHLTRPIDQYTRGDLLRLAALLHDIGKIVSLQSNANGETSSPSHGPIGAWIANPIVQRLGLTAVEQNYVLNLISEHLIPSDLIEMAINNDTSSQAVADLLLENRNDRAIELLLLAYADWLGCDVMPQLEAIRDKRIAVAHACLEIMTRSLK